MKIRIAGTVNDSVVDGPGIRFTVFTQGCPHKCKGCHNPQTHSADGGYNADTDDLLEIMFKNPLCDGITISGGEPFMQTDAVADLCKKSRGKGYNVIVYTGFLWEKLIENEKNIAVLKYTDYLIDGEFIEELKSLDLKFRGSANQRIINVKESLKTGVCIEKRF